MRVASLNFPVSYPAEPINGICVPGFVHWRHLKQAVYPASFYERIRELPDFDAKFLSMDTEQEFQSIQYLPDEEYESWITHHIQREKLWFELVHLVLTEDAPDFTAFIFDGVDKLQHLCWRFLDPALRSKNPSPWEQRILDLCRAYFTQLDHLIERVVADAGPDAKIFIASDHGFGPTEVVFFANTWLAENGYLSWSGEAPAPESGTTNIADQRVKFQAEAIDWNRTTAFALNPSSNGIYIRRATDTGSPGIPAGEYEDFRARLAKEMRALVNPWTGSRFFRHVFTREEAFPGDASERAPDLTLVMEDNGFLSVIHSDEIFRRRPEPWGTHYPNGIFMAAGPGIAPLGKMQGLRIVDVAPILLRSLGFGPEIEMEGDCPENLIEAVWPQAAASPELRPFVVDQDTAERNPEVEAEVLKRLRAIGYIAP
jgi:predicted AlkP superfamily phosphohydrolase/phosphomutase